MNTFSDHLKTRMSIDPVTGEQRYTYYYKRNRCPTSLIKGPLSKQYIGYYLILRDLEDTYLWLNKAYSFLPVIEKGNVEGEDYYRQEFIGDEGEHLVAKSLFFSSLIFYGKCFTQAKGRGIKLDKSFVPREYHEKHDRIMKYRHTLAAHSGEGQWDTGNVRLLLSPKKRNNIGVMIKPEMKRLDFEDDRMDEYQFLKLVEIIHRKVKAKSEDIGQKIINEIIIPKGENYWRRLSKKG